MNKYKTKINDALNRIMPILDPEKRYPLPAVRVVQKPREGWAGICSPTITGVQNDGSLILDIEIFIQKFTFKDDGIFFDILAHECCHYVDLHNQCYKEMYAIALDRITNSKHHGDSFYLLSNKINSTCGNNDEIIFKSCSYLEDISKFVLMENVKGTIYYSYTCRLSKSQFARLAEIYVKYPNKYKLIKSKKVIFNNSDAIIGSSMISFNDSNINDYFLNLWKTEDDLLEQVLKTKLKPEFFENIEIIRRGL